ncbi:MAG: hypothetical protein QGF59_05720, partial [Pirellulaceae bacterium]|nr:hypothetical protein [Pirellulaceae bacterium]
QQLMYRGSPDSPKLRVTATVIADVRGNVVKGIPMGQSFLSDRKTRILDLDERFRFRLIGTDSVFKARVTAGTLQSSETIPIGPMNDLAESLLDKWTLMTIDGGVTVEGVDHTEAWDWLGKSLAGLEGMDTNFETTHDSVGATNPKYPSIVGITYNIDSQTTDLALETFYPQRAV